MEDSGIRVITDVEGICRRIRKAVMLDPSVGVRLSPPVERVRKDMERLVEKLLKDPSSVGRLEKDFLADEPADLSYRVFSPGSRIDLERELKPLTPTIPPEAFPAGLSAEYNEDAGEKLGNGVEARWENSCTQP